MSATNRPAYLKATFYLLYFTLERSNGLTYSSAAQICSFNCWNCLIFLLYLYVFKSPVTCKGRQIFFAKLLQATKHLCFIMSVIVESAIIMQALFNQLYRRHCCLNKLLCYICTSLETGDFNFSADGCFQSISFKLYTTIFFSWYSWFLQYRWFR